MRIQQLITTLCVFSAAAFAELPMTSEYETALKLSEAYQKPVAILFTGSDWDQDSKALEKKIADPAFEELMGKEALFVQIDYSQERSLGEDAAVEHYALKKKYKVVNFPTVVVLDADHREISRTGLLPISGREFALQLKMMLKEYQSLQQTSGSAEKSYLRAKKLGCNHLRDHYLQLGLEKERTPRLLLEAYLHASSKEEKVKWRKEIVASSDPDSHVQLAILDYQESQKVSDLEEALVWVSEKSSEYWKLHLLIAEHFLGEGKHKDAMQHAHQAAERSPEKMRVAILDMVSLEASE